jgi:hypothetical protein
MPTNKQVVDAIEQWSGNRPEKMSQNLEEWWNQTAPGATHKALAFDPDGIDDLVDKLQKEFAGSPDLAAGDFKATGNIKTLQDLVDALQPVEADALADVPRAEKTIGARKGGIQKRTSKKGVGRKRKTHKQRKAHAKKKSTRRGKPAGKKRPS